MLSLNLVTRLSGWPIRLQGTGINDIQEKGPENDPIQEPKYGNDLVDLQILKLHA